RFTPERRYFVHWYDVPVRFFRKALQVKNRNCLVVAPRLRRRVVRGRISQTVGRIGGLFQCNGCPQSGGLVMTVSSMDSSEVIEDEVGPKSSDYADHIFENGVAPDFLRFFWRLRKTEIPRPREIKLHPVAAGGSQQFLCPDQAQLWRLFRAKIVLAAFAAGDR